MKTKVWNKNNCNKIQKIIISKFKNYKKNC